MFNSPFKFCHLHAGDARIRKKREGEYMVHDAQLDMVQHFTYYILLNSHLSLKLNIFHLCLMW